MGAPQTRSTGKDMNHGINGRAHHRRPGPHPRPEIPGTGAYGPPGVARKPWSGIIFFASTQA